MYKYFIILGTIVNIVWFFPVFRQWQTRFRYYFLILAAACVFTQIMYITNLLKYTLYYYLFFSSLLPIFLIKKDLRTSLHLLYTIPLLIVIFALMPRPETRTIEYIFFTLHMLIFIRLLKIFIVETVSTNSFNLFLFVLLLYELTLISRCIYAINYVNPSLLYNAIASSMEVALGLFFCIFKEKNKNTNINFGAIGYGSNQS